jgi:RNA-directed DNA polymerase
VVTGDSPETLAKAKEVVVEFLTERGLELSPEKTRIVSLAEGFTFLGQNVRLYGDKVLIKPSKEAQARIYDKIRDIVQRNKSAGQRDLIRMLNPVIRGWVNYHRHAVSSVAFSRLDFMVWKLLWQWAKRRHRGKSRTWIKQRYWRTRGSRHWTFAADVVIDGKPRTISLVYATDTPIRRHVKVRAEVNPYSPQWASYLAERTRRPVFTHSTDGTDS